MIQYLKVVRCLVSDFLYWNINKIPRSENAEADRLSKYASIAIPNPDNIDERVFVEYLPQNLQILKLQRSYHFRMFPGSICQKLRAQRQKIR